MSSLLARRLRISIHALREEGDWMISTSSVRTRNFYPRPPRGGRPPWHRRTCWPKHISIHALREEGDRHLRKARPAGHEISIHALREEGDWRGTLSSRATQISIHALREEGDSRTSPAPPTPSNFYPRPPRGGRQGTACLLYTSPSPRD